MSYVNKVKWREEKVRFGRV